MTVVVAVACTDGTVVMGGDSFCGDEDVLNLCRADKVYTVGTVGVGICGWVRSEQIFERVLKEYIPDKKQITADWLRNDLTDHIHDAMKEHGIMHDKDGVHEMKESAYLLAFGGTIYHFDEDFSLWDSRRPISAIGAGRKFALGAMGALLSQAPVLDEENRPDVEYARRMVQIALEVSSTWSPWVRPPFKVVRVPSAPDSE